MERWPLVSGDSAEGTRSCGGGVESVSQSMEDSLLTSAVYLLERAVSP